MAPQQKTHGPGTVDDFREAVKDSMVQTERSLNSKLIEL